MSTLFLLLFLLFIEIIKNDYTETLNTHLKVIFLPCAVEIPWSHFWEYQIKPVCASRFFPHYHILPADEVVQGLTSTAVNNLDNNFIKVSY